MSSVIVYCASLSGAAREEKVTFRLNYPATASALAARELTSTHQLAIFKLALPHLMAAAPRFTCDCGARASWFVSNQLIYLSVPAPDGPLVHDFARAVCALRGPCELAAREWGAALARNGGMEDVYVGGTQTAALRRAIVPLAIGRRVRASCVPGVTLTGKIVRTDAPGSFAVLFDGAVGGCDGDGDLRVFPRSALSLLACG